MELFLSQNLRPYRQNALFYFETGISMALSLWEKRDDYHHLNPTIETDRQRLEALAYEKVSFLKEIESEVFKFSIVDGKLVPENRKYWAVQPNGTVPVFIRLD